MTAQDVLDEILNNPKAAYSALGLTGFEHKWTIDNSDARALANATGPANFPWDPEVTHPGCTGGCTKTAVCNLRVTAEQFQSLHNADSVGAHLGRHIKPHFHFTKVA